MMGPVHLYVAFLDVLAYRERLEQDRQSGNLDLRNELSSALRVFDNVNDAVFQVQAISDTIIVTCLNHDHFPEFLWLLRGVFLSFLGQCLFIRGAVAYSRHFQSNRLTYSHGVARGYELESQQAVYPRIVIDDNVVKMYEVGEELPNIRSAGLLCKEKGVFFLDILTADNWGYVYSQAATIYRKSLSSSRFSEGAFNKHLRFERYLLSSRHAPKDARPYVGKIEAY